MSVASASAPPPPSPSTVIDSNTFGQSQAINADVLSAVELEQFKEYIEAIKAAYHRALTRQSLKKYDYEHRESSKIMSERYGRVLGFSLLDKAGGFGEIVEVKTLKEYKLQQTLTVEEAMLNTAPDWEEERRIKAPTIQSLLQKLLDHVRQTTWIPSDQTEKICNIVISDFAARYHELRRCMNNPILNAVSYRTVMAGFFSQLKAAIDAALDFCREKHKKMKRRGVLAETTNWLRLLSYFRAELSKRAKTNLMVKLAISKVIAPSLDRRQSELLRFGLQSLTDAMPSTGFSLIKNYKPLAPIRKSDQLIPSDSANPAAQSDNSESSTSDKNEAEKDKNGRVELTFLDDLGEMLRPRQLKSHVEGSENDFVLSAKLHELEARTFQKKILRQRDNARYLIADEDRQKYLLDFEEFNAILDAEPEFLNENRNAFSAGKASFEKGMEQTENVGETYLSRFSDRALKGNSNAGTFSDRSLGEKLSLTFDPTFLEKLDEQVMKLKEIDEIYQELLRSEMADVYELIEDKVDLENHPSIPFEYSAVLNIAHLGKGNGQQTMAKTLAFAPAAEDVDKGQLTFDDYLSFMQNRPNDYITEVLTPVNTDRLIATPIVANTDDIAEIVDEGQKQPKFVKGYWNSKDLDQTRLETSSLILAHEEEAARRIEERKKQLSREASEMQGPLVMDDSSSDASSFDVGSSVRGVSRSGVVYDPLTGMPITDDGNQPVRLLDGERRADPAEMDYMESQKVFQEQLEKIWDRFKMPMGQRLDMAMKYGKKEDNRRLLDRAIPIWDQTATLIENREKILLTLREFEEKQMNPTRFRRKNAEELERESAERQRILQKLDRTNKALEKCIETIRFSLKDEVTYNGEVYREKMKHDYSNILYEVVQKYKTTLLMKTDSRPLSAGPSSTRASTSSVSLQQQPKPNSESK